MLKLLTLLSFAIFAPAAKPCIHINFLPRIFAIDKRFIKKRQKKQGLTPSITPAAITLHLGVINEFKVVIVSGNSGKISAPERKQADDASQNAAMTVDVFLTLQNVILSNFIKA